MSLTIGDERLGRYDRRFARGDHETGRVEGPLRLARKLDPDVAVGVRGDDNSRFAEALKLRRGP